jgi:hypothetical protein
MNRAVRVAMVLGWLAACSDTYSSSQPDSGAPDAGAARDGGAADASGAVDDGGSSADATSDGGGGDACAHTFCESFDDGQYTTRWVVLQAGNTTLGPTDAGATSPPYSLGAGLPSADGGSAKRFGYLTRTFPGTASSVVIEFDARFDALAGGYVNFFELALEPAAANVAFYSVGLSEGSGGTSVFEYLQFPDGGYSETDTSFPMLAIGQWAHLKIVMTLGAKAGYVIYENGVMVDAHPIKIPSYLSVRPELGVTFVTEPAGPMRVLYDNVTFDVVP